MKKQLLSLMMVLSLLIGIFPMSALAAEPDDTENAAVETVETSTPEENLPDESDPAEEPESAPTDESAESDTSDVAEPEPEDESAEPDASDVEEPEPEEGTAELLETASGTCGSNLTWELDDSGTLTISGTGAMTDWTTSSAPWYSYRNSITDVVIESGVTSIGYRAFYECSSLTSVTIPDSVTYYIGSYAFYGCTGLTSVTIPDSVTSIGKYAFYDCTSLTSVTIGNSVTSIGNYAFESCTGLTNITIPDSVTSIGHYAFCNCIGLTSVTIPDSVTSIGGSAFSSCTSLTNITIPDSVTSIDSWAFENCTGLTSVFISDIAKWCRIRFGDNHSNPLRYAHNLYLNGILVTELVIPDSITSIGSYAFHGYTGLTSVTIPDSVTYIGGSTFENCTGLASVTIPDSVTSIGDSAFEYCTGLTSVFISDIARWCDIGFGDCFSNPLYYAHNLYLNGALVTRLVIPDSVTSIGGYAFCNCTGLTSVTIPDSVTYISYNAFCNCTGLTSVTIPDSVTSIGNWAFGDCTGLTSVTIPDSVTYISYHAFCNCTGLTSVTIPDSVTSIGSCAFYGCTSLTSVTIPDSVTSIGDHAFWVCNNLTDVYYGGSEDEWAVISIGTYNTCLTNATIHYNSTGPESGDVKLTLNPSTDVSNPDVELRYSISTLYQGQEMLLEARIENGTQLRQGDCLWSTNNADAIDLGDISFSHGLGDASTTAYAYVKLKAVGSGTAQITLLLSNGKSAVCTVTCPGEKPVPVDPFYQVKQTESYSLLEEYVNKWNKMFNAYTQEVSNQLNESAGNTEAQRESSIAAMAQKMKEDDNDSSNGRHLTFDADFPKGWQDDAYTALATHLYDYTSNKMNVGDSYNEIAIVNAVKNALSVSTKTYYFDDVVMSVSVLRFSNTKLGNITCYSSKNVNEKYCAAITTTPDECSAAISDYVQELEELSDAAVRNVYTSLADDLLNCSASKFTQDWLKKRIKPYIAQLDKAGVGDLVNDLANCYESWQLVDKVSKGDIESAASMLDKVSSLNFGYDSIEDRGVSNAMENLKNASNSLCDALVKYQKGELKENALQTWLRTTFCCPVSIAVYNSDNEQIGYVGEDDIWYADSILIEEDGDAKIITSYTGDKLSFEVVGTDYGTLSCSVEDYGTDGIATGRTNYYDIPLDPGTALSMTMTGASGESAEPMAITTATGETVEADEYISVIDDGGVTIACTVETDDGSTSNTASGAGVYVRGDAAVLTAIPADGYSFGGWYEGDALVSTSNVYEFTAREDVSLTVQFYENPPEAVVATISSEDSHVVNLYDPDYQLNTDALVIAAEYQNEKMTNITSGTLTDGKVTFSKPIAENWKLFFLDPETYVPLYPSITLTENS